MAVSIDGPVGGRLQRQNVTNNAKDQAKIIDLLTKIPKAQGGKKEEWPAPPLSGPNGSCPSFVADAIWDFQVFWKSKGAFHNIDGVVDPGMHTLAQLNLLAVGLVPPVPLPGPSIAPLTQNPKIKLDGTNAIDRSPPMNPWDWVRRTQATFDTLCSNSLGRQIVQGRHRTIFVEPYLGNDLNAHSYWGPAKNGTPEYDGVTFTADNFDRTQSDPGCRADEVLLHELIHVAEGHFGLYENVPGNELKYARSDFLTVIGTNVYSSSLSRGLRADHDKYKPMPSPYATDPREHVTLFRGNYQKVYHHTRALFNLFKNQPSPWNPFKLFAP
jgi:hypothetical protein